MPSPHRHFKYEHKGQKLLPRRQYQQRLLWHGLLALGVIVSALLIGVLGYRLLAGFPWIDSLLNASMILGGMGPVGELPGPAAKIFASFYALFSGLIFIGVLGILLAAPVHRFLHRLHLEKDAPSEE
jgi:ABC-type phosphate transport system permease subunit